MTELRRMTRYAHMRKGTNNKFYEVEVQEHDDGPDEMIFRWGRIGTAGQSKTSTGAYDFLVSVANQQFETKLKKGYEEANAMEALAAAAQIDLTERQNRGLDPVEIEIPCFHAGKSEKRCQEFAQKYLDKLNLIRASRWDLGDKYSKQIEALLKSYCSEWRRIRRTKAHGHLAENALAHTAFRLFFAAMKDNTKCYVCGYFEGVGAV